MAFNQIETAHKNEDFITLQDEIADGYEVARWSVEKSNWVREEGAPVRLTPAHWMQLPKASSVPSSSNLRGRDEKKALPLRRFGRYAAVFVAAGLTVLFPAFIGNFEPPSSHHTHRAGQTFASRASVPAPTVLSQDVASAAMANLNVRTVSEAPLGIETAKVSNIEQKQGRNQARLEDDDVAQDLAPGRQDLEATKSSVGRGDSAAAPAREPAAVGDRTRAAAPPLGAIEDQIALWVKRGEDVIAAGDFVNARLLFQRAADVGDAQGALMLAATYDPDMLDRFRAKGLTMDIAKARWWYEKARDLGSPAAARRLELLAQPRR
jgi:hypothetical protein